MESGGLDLVDMWNSMGFVAKAVAFVLFFMSMWSIGVAVERIYTFIQAKNQSKVYAPQVAKHLKDGRLKEAIAISSNKDFRYSHLARSCSRDSRNTSSSRKAAPTCRAKTCSTPSAARFSAPPR